MVTLHCRPPGPAVPSTHVRSTDNDSADEKVVRKPWRRNVLGARIRHVRVGLVMAGGRRGAARVLAERRCVRRRSAPRDRRCAREHLRYPRAGLGRGHVRGVGADERSHGDDRVRRLQGVAHPPRSATRPGRLESDGRRRPRRARPDRRDRACRAVRSSRCPRRFRRDVRRPALAPSASGCLPPSTCARGAARTTSRRRIRPRHSHRDESAGPGGCSSLCTSPVAGRLHI